MPASQEQSEVKLERAARIFTIIKEAARLGRECPTNAILAERMHCTSPRISDAISFLHAAGMIKVKRMNARRIVTICATGDSTAGAEGKPHWCARENELAK